MNAQYEVGQKINLDIKKIGINGEGIGYYNKMAVFVNHVLPLENVDVELVEVYDKRLVGKLIKLNNESPHRIKPFCPIYEQCGGCQLQHLESSEVALTKRQIIMESINRYTYRNLPSDIVKDTVIADQEIGYRFKASLPVRFNGKNHVGMFQANSRKFVQMDACPIQHPVVNEVIGEILHLMNIYKIKGYDDKYKSGDVSSVVVRVSSLDEVQVTFVLLRDHKKIKALVEEIVEKDSRIVSVFKVYEKKYQNVGFFNKTLAKLYGKDMIGEELGGFKFELKPDAFFQLNPSQADKFYQEMVRLADLKKYMVAIDAFAGTAPVSHYIADKCHQVYAIEIDKQSCDSAKASLKQNGISNVTVLQSDFKRALSGLKMKKIDVMFFDPPRVGLGKPTIDLILESKPKKIVYGSCNPSTLAKDLNLLMKSYQLVETVPLDMFPQTSLVESVSLLVLK